MPRAFSATERLSGPGRYELKMVYDGLQSSLVRSLILGHSQLFQTAYPARQVNNIYFDSPDLQLQNDHIQGSPERFKLRLRWYHSTWNIRGGSLEVKHKKGRLGWKKISPIDLDIALEHLGWPEIMGRISASLDRGLEILFKSTGPVLINSYQREYYHSADRQIRLTLDRDVRVLDQRFGIRPNLTRYSPSRNLSILEIKADSESHQQIADILEEFPQYCSAYSKYLQGTESLSI